MDSLKLHVPQLIARLLLPLVFAGGLVFSAPLWAEDGREHAMHEGKHHNMQADRQAQGDPFGGRLFPPELVMQNKTALKLTKAQSKQFLALMRDFQAGVIEPQWQMSEARDGVLGALDASPVREKAIRSALDTMLSLENQVKTDHIMLLVRIRNLLDDAQVEILKAKVMEARGR